MAELNKTYFYDDEERMVCEKLYAVKRDKEEDLLQKIEYKYTMLKRKRVLPQDALPTPLKPDENIFYAMEPLRAWK